MVVWVPRYDRAGYDDLFCRASGPVILGGLWWPACVIRPVQGSASCAAWSAYQDLVGVCSPTTLIDEEEVVLKGIKGHRFAPVPKPGVVVADLDNTVIGPGLLAHPDVTAGLRALPVPLVIATGRPQCPPTRGKEPLGAAYTVASNGAVAIGEGVLHTASPCPTRR